MRGPKPTVRRGDSRVEKSIRSLSRGPSKLGDAPGGTVNKRQKNREAGYGKSRGLGGTSPMVTNEIATKKNKTGRSGINSMQTVLGSGKKGGKKDCPELGSRMFPQERV